MLQAKAPADFLIGVINFFAGADPAPRCLMETETS